MKKKLLIFILILMGVISCITDKEDDFINQLEELEEFQIAEARIDSLNKTGISVSISLHIIEDSFYPEDSLKNVKVAFVNEDYGFADNILLIVKYDKTENKIIEVIPNDAD